MEVPKRIDDVNVFYKRKKKMKVFRYFNKERSLFKPWKMDTPESLNEMMQLDFKKMKINRIVRD